MLITYHGRMSKRLYPEVMWVVPVELKQYKMNPVIAEMVFAGESEAQRFHDRLFKVFKISIGEEIHHHRK